MPNSEAHTQLHSAQVGPGRCGGCDVSTGRTFFHRLYGLLAVCRQSSVADATPNIPVTCSVLEVIGCDMTAAEDAVDVVFEVKLSTTRRTLSTG